MGVMGDVLVLVGIAVGAGLGVRLFFGFFTKIAQASRSSGPGAASIVVCKLDADVAHRVPPRSMADLLRQCAVCCGNDVIKKFGVSPKQREVTICEDPMNPMVSFIWHVPSSKAIPITRYTEESWRELMQLIKHKGVQAFAAFYTREYGRV